MQKARDVMTMSLVTCPPETTVSEVARLMENRNIGNVLITKDGELLGIVTDRDITTRVVASERDPREAVIRDYMSSPVITGKPDWDVKRVADTMGRHQIRRLPIVDKGRPVGIISLGDVALQDRLHPVVAESLQDISEPAGLHLGGDGKSLGLGSLLLGLLGGAALAMVLAPKPGEELRQDLQDADWGRMARQAALGARSKVDTLISR